VALILVKVEIPGAFIFGCQSTHRGLEDQKRRMLPTFNWAMGSWLQDGESSHAVARPATG